MPRVLCLNINLELGRQYKIFPQDTAYSQSPDKMAFGLTWEGHFDNKTNLASVGVSQEFPLTSLNAGFTITCKSLVRSDSLPLMPVHPVKKKTNPAKSWAHQSEGTKYNWILKNSNLVSPVFYQVQSYIALNPI